MTTQGPVDNWHSKRVKVIDNVKWNMENILQDMQMKEMNVELYLSHFRALCYYGGQYSFDCAIIIINDHLYVFNCNYLLICSNLFSSKTF